jgi:hypothetical protein
MSQTLPFPSDDDVDADDVSAAGTAAPSRSARTIATPALSPSAAGSFYGLPAVMCWVLAIRAVVFTMGVLSIQFAGGHAISNAASGHPWIAWDGDHYLYILQNGYAPDMSPDSRFYDIAYFPLYPLLAKPLTWFMSTETAMVALSNSLSMVGFMFFYLWIRNFAGQKKAFLATLFMATFPGAVFFSAGLTEGPFFTFAAVSLWLLQLKRLYAAAVVSGLATMLRPTGVALAMAVWLSAVIELWPATLPLWQRLGRLGVLGLISISGGLCYQIFLWERYRTPDVYFRAQEFWEEDDKKMVEAYATSGGAPRYSVPWFIDRAQTPQAWNRIIALIFVGVMVVGFFRPGPVPRVLFVLPLIIFLMTYLPNNGLRASSIIRYETAGLPVFALAAYYMARRPLRPLLVALVCLQFAVQMYYAVLFSRGVWVG